MGVGDAPVCDGIGEVDDGVFVSVFVCVCVCVCGGGSEPLVANGSYPELYDGGARDEFVCFVSSMRAPPLCLEPGVRAPLAARIHHALRHVYIMPCANPTFQPKREGNVPTISDGVKGWSPNMV
jgi:hypothetical protein